MCAVLVPSLRSPLSSITSTPPSCGAVAGSAASSSSRRALTASGSQRDSDKKNCNRCTAGWPAPATGSAPASAVSVLFRSRGASSPARYSPNPRRCATCVNRSSNRAAYPPNGPGAGGHAFGLVITATHSPETLLRCPTPPSTLIQQTTARMCRKIIRSLPEWGTLVWCGHHGGRQGDAGGEVRVDLPASG